MKLWKLSMPPPQTRKSSLWFALYCLWLCSIIVTTRLIWISTSGRGTIAPFKKEKTITQYLISTLLEFCPSGKVSSDLKRPCKERRNASCFTLQHRTLKRLNYHCAPYIDFYNPLTYLTDPRGQANGVLTNEGENTAASFWQLPQRIELQLNAFLNSVYICLFSVQHGFSLYFV